MDEKRIQLDFAEEECIDLSISFTPACALYLVIKKGLDQVESDLRSMDEYVESLKNPLTSIDDQARANLIMQATSERSIAVLAYNKTLEFLQELHNVIKELEPTQNNKKVIIQKPNWSGSST